MGLGIGITVKRQLEGQPFEGYNPKGTQEEIEQEVEQYLRKRFPNEKSLPFGFDVLIRKDDYEFRASIPRHGSELQEKGYLVDDVYLGFTSYILDHFSSSEGINMHVWKSF